MRNTHAMHRSICCYGFFFFCQGLTLGDVEQSKAGWHVAGGVATGVAVGVAVTVIVVVAMALAMPVVVMVVGED